MNKKIYMIMPDTSAPFDLGKFHTYVESLYKTGFIKAWWHYIPGGVYFVATTLSVNQIYNLLIKHIPLRHHIIIEVNVENKQGWLPKQAWEWFKRNK